MGWLQSSDMPRVSTGYWVLGFFNTGLRLSQGEPLIYHKKWLSPNQLEREMALPEICVTILQAISLSSKSKEILPASVCHCRCRGGPLGNDHVGLVLTLSMHSSESTIVVVWESEECSERPGVLVWF